MLKILLKDFGETYSEELGIDLKFGKPREIFKWFLASLLFGARISETIAKKTYRAFRKYNLLTPRKIAKTSWNFLVSKVMREGGYVRYDGKTSNEVIRVSKEILKRYQGDLNKLHREAKDSKDLEKRLQSLYSVGPVTANIFLRELRGVWKKASPSFSPFVLLAKRHLGIKGDLLEFWQKNKIKGYNFVHFEAALLRLGKDYCYKEKKELCPLKKFHHKNIREIKN